MILALLPPLLLNVSPEVGLAANAPGSRKVVDLLVLAHVLQLGGADQSSPEAVPRRRAVPGSYQVEASRLESIHDAVVSVSLAADPESQLRVRK